MFYVKLDDPANTRPSGEGDPGIRDGAITPFGPCRIILSMMTPDNLPGFDHCDYRIVIGVAVIIGFLVIFQAMYTAVMERTREIGILKSLGASKFYIVNVVLRETLLLAIAGSSSASLSAWRRGA